MRAQEFDAFALRSYSFAVRKTNSYFSITTLLLSAAVFIVSVFITFPSISHLWISRQQLPRLQSTTIAYPNPLTSTLLCYAANDAASNGSVPQARLFNQNRSQIFYPSVSMDQLRKKRPQLAKQISQQYFGCFDLAGFTFAQGSLNIDVDVLANNVTLYIESISSSQILKKEESSFMKLTSVVKGKNYILNIQVLNANILDTLRMNAETVVMNSFLNVATSDFQRVYPVFKEALYARFRLQLLIQYEYVAKQIFNYNHQTLTVTRLDFGSILGGVLSWVSILGLLCSFLVGPAMEKALQLLQTEALFLLPARLRAPSLLRFLLAPLGLFRKERAFLALQARLEQLKDVAKTLKILKTLRRLTPGTAKTQEAEIMASEQSFTELRTEENDNEVAHYQSSDSKTVPFQSSQDQKPQYLLTKAKTIMFNWLDSGSDPISITYNGKGHGSKCSLCLAILFALGFLAFLSLFGVFNFSEVVTISSTKNYQQFSYNFSPDELVFTSQQPSQIMVFLLDGYFNRIKKYSLVNSTDCLAGLNAKPVAQIYTYGYYFYCLSQAVTLTTSPEPSQRTSLFVDNSNVKVSPVYIFHKRLDASSQYYNPLDLPIFISASLSNPTYYYQQLFKLTNLVDSSQNSLTYGQFTPLSTVQSIQGLAGGINIVLNYSQTTIQSNANTFFDIIQNIWSFAIICFTVLLMKITKYVNLRQKDRRISKEKSEFRDSLCVLLSKIDGMMNGRHGKELGRMKYYFKEKLQQ